MDWLALAIWLLIGFGLYCAVQWAGVSIKGLVGKLMGWR